MKKPSLSFSGWRGPVVLLVVAILGFGLMLPGLGFYWDDWAKILVSRLYGLIAYPAYYAGDRPLSAWTHMLFTPLLGESPLPWQIFNLLLRWLSAVGMLWTLNLLWPQGKRQNLVAALLFLVYPVFLQQPAAVTFHQQWLQYALFFLSLGAMTRAARPGERRAWGWMALALAAMLLQLSVTEYFVPLELVRPVVLWIAITGGVDSRQPAVDSEEVFSRQPVVGSKRKNVSAPGVSQRWLKRAARVLRAWAPYLVALAGYVVFRLFLMRLPGRDPYRADTLYDFLSSPIKTLRQVSLVALVDEVRILVEAWSDLLHFQIAGAAPFTLLSYAVGLTAGAVVVMYLLRLRETGGEPRLGAAERGGSAGGTSFRGPGAIAAALSPLNAACRPGWTRQAFMLGLVAVLLGPVPAWITGRQVVFDFHSDRYAMPAMFGAALLFAAGIEWLAQRRVQRALLAGILVALAVGVQLRAANDYRWIWTSEERFFWQLAWRAPGLKAPTALFLETEPFPNQGLFSTSAALNLMYPQGLEPFSPSQVNRLSYWVYTLRPRYQQAPESFTIGLTSTFRTLHFEGQTPDSLLVYNNPARSNCLWVLSDRDRNNPYLPPLVHDFLPISNLGRIQPERTPGYPPEDMIGAEPPHTWCYFFEKADLARQQQDWAQAARLAAEAKAQGYTPAKSGSNSPYEWLPFIEGLSRTGQWGEAARLTRRAHESDAHFQAMYCELWGKELKGDSADALKTVNETKQFLGCR